MTFNNVTDCKAMNILYYYTPGNCRSVKLCHIASVFPQGSPSKRRKRDANSDPLRQPDQEEEKAMNSGNLRRIKRESSGAQNDERTKGVCKFVCPCANGECKLQLNLYLLGLKFTGLEPCEMELY